MYLTYAQYQEIGGTLLEADFDRLIPSAEALLDRASYQRLQRVPFDTQPVRTQDAVRRCLVTLVGTYAHADKADTQEYASMSNNGVTVSYKQKSNMDYQRENGQEISLWLSGVRDIDNTPLLFAGV